MILFIVKRNILLGLCFCIQMAADLHNAGDPLQHAIHINLILFLKWTEQNELLSTIRTNLAWT